MGGSSRPRPALYSTSSWKPFSICGREGCLAIASGDQHVCGIRTGGTLWCKGDNEQGQLGDGTLVRKESAVQVGGAADWTSITAAGAATCGIRGNGDLHCWGSNDYGEIGDGTAFHVAPTVVP